MASKVRGTARSLRDRLCIGLTALTWGTAAAAPAAIETVLISKSADIADVEIRFACPNRFLAHSPMTAAVRSEITLMRMDRCEGTGDSISEATRPPGRALAALEEIEYTARGGTDATLRLRFDRPVLVTVDQTGDLRSLRLHVRVPAGSAPEAKAADPLPAAAVAPIARPGPSPDQVARVEARATKATQPKPVAAPVTPLFVLNLRSTTNPIDLGTEGAGLAQSGQTMYVVDVKFDDQVWHRLRLGFFATEADAHSAWVDLRARYPDSWVTKVSAAERASAGAGTMAGSTGVIVATATPAGEGQGTLTDAQTAELLTQARGAIIDQDFPHAIQLATRILQEPPRAETAEARELLGLARERNTQIAHAIAEYRRYLADYPDGEGAARVQQRLAALTTAREQPQASLRKDKVAVLRDNSWDAYGGVGQYYRRDSIDVGNAPTIEQSAVYSDAELVVRRTGERFDVGTRSTLGYTYDMSGGDRSSGNQTRIYNLYFDLNDKDWGLSSRLGRQTLRNQGVLGRFDGALVSWQWAPSYRLNLLTGYPVYQSDQSIDTSRLFYGISVDVLDVLDWFDVNVFFNMQDVNGINDRQAVGGEIRYFGENRSLVSSVDYDLGYNQLNSFVTLGNWNFDNRMAINAMFDWRKTPYLTTENALIGQSASSIDELLHRFTEDEIRQMAADQSGSMETLALGVARPISERFQVSADVTVSQFNGTSGSDGVPGVPDSGPDAWYYVSLIGSSLIGEGDVSILGLRYMDGSTAKTAAIFLDTRYPLTQRLRLNPRVLLSRRVVTVGDATELVVRPGMRVLYRMGRNYLLELDMAGEFGSSDSGGETTDTTGYYMYMGYRADF